jgi:tRNA(adenine34) deaminase
MATDRIASLSSESPLPRNLLIPGYNLKMNADLIGIEATCHCSPSLVPSGYSAVGFRMARTGKRRKWSASVTTDSTHPPAGLFKKSAAVIAKTLASKTVSPKGTGSGMRMLTFYINRAGKNLSTARRKELAKAKKLLSQRIDR